MNILITGAGLVGCHVARTLSERGHRAALYDVSPREDYIRRVAGDLPVVRGDVRDLPALVETMQQERTDVVVHTAYVIGDRLAQRPYAGLGVNIGGAIAVAEAARLTGARRLIFASTFGVYQWGLRPTSPVTEDYPVVSNAFYRASKLACEVVLQGYAGQYGLEVATARFAQVYGFGHYTGGDLIGEVLHRLMETGLRGGPVEVDSQLFGSNDYVYARDVAQGVALLCEKPLESRVFNLGSGVLSRVEHVVEAFQAALPGVEVRPVEGGSMNYTPDRAQPLSILRLQEETGYRSAYDLTAGLTDLARELTRNR